MQTVGGKISSSLVLVSSKVTYARYDRAHIVKIKHEIILNMLHYLAKSTQTDMIPGNESLDDTIRCLSPDKNIITKLKIATEFVDNK